MVQRRGGRRCYDHRFRSGLVAEFIAGLFVEDILLEEIEDHRFDQRLDLGRVRLARLDRVLNTDGRICQLVGEAFYFDFDSVEVNQFLGFGPSRVGLRM